MPSCWWCWSHTHYLHPSAASMFAHLANNVFVDCKHTPLHYSITLYGYASSFPNTPYARGLHQILPKQFHVHLHTSLSQWIASDDCWLVMLFILGPLSMSMLGQDLSSLFNPLYDTLISRGLPRTNWFHRTLQVITSYHPTSIERKAGQHIISTSPGPTKA